MRSELLKTTRRGIRWSMLSSLVQGAGFFLMFLILVRVLDQTAFGVMGLANVAIGLGNQGTDMGISAAVVQRPEHSRRGLSSLYWFSLGLGGCFWLLSLPIGWGMAAFYDIPELRQLIFWSGLSFVFNAAGLQFFALFQRHMNFRSIARAEIAGAVALVAVTLSTAFAGAGVYCFVYGILTGSLVKNASLMALSPRSRFPDWHFSARAIRPYMGFGSWQTGRSLLVYFILRLDTLIIGKYLGKELLGVYEIVKELLFRPLSFISPILGKVGFPLMASQQTDQPRLARIFLHHLRVANSLTVPLYVGFMLFAEPILRILIGEEFTTYAPLLTLLALYVLLRSLLSPMGSVITAKGRPKLGFWWNAFVLSPYIFSLYIGVHYGLTGAAIGLIVCQFVLNLLAYWGVINRLVNIRVSELLRFVGIPVLLTIAAAAPLIATYTWWSGEVIGTALAMLAFAGLLLLLYQRFNQDVYEQWLALVKRQ